MTRMHLGNEMSLRSFKASERNRNASMWIDRLGDPDSGEWQSEPY